MPHSYEDYTVDVIRLTDAAALLRFEDGEERWVPLSCIEDGTEWAEDFEDLDTHEFPVADAQVCVATWFARKEGFL